MSTQRINTHMVWCAWSFTVILSAYLLCSLPSCARSADGMDMDTRVPRTLVSSRPAKSENDVAGFVQDISGNWELVSRRETRQLSQGDAVVNGWSLTPLSEDAKITIILKDGTKLKCPGCIACSGPIVSREPSAAFIWLSAAVNMFIKKPQSWTDALARGIPQRTAPALQDGVLSVEGGQINLSPIILGAPDGRYYARIYKIGDGGGGSTLFGPAVLTIKKEHSVVINTGILEPGVYRVRLCEGKDDPHGEEAWFLLSARQDYQHNLHAFEKARRSARELEADARRTGVTARELLRAYMASLAVSPSTQSK